MRRGAGIYYVLQVFDMPDSKLDRPSPAGVPWYRSIWARSAQLVLGLLVYGFSLALMIRSSLGLGPWDAFHVGLHLMTGITIGTASILAGLVIVAGLLLMGVRPGVGTLANMVFIGVFVDLLLPVVPQAQGWIWPPIYFLSGIGLCGFATGLYIGAGLGKGPRDGLMIGLSQRTGWPVRRVRTLIEISVLAGGWLMGGTVGLGTVIFALLIGPVTQWGLQLFGITSTGAVHPIRLNVPVEEHAHLCDAA